jgi:hypothetical protein
MYPGVKSVDLQGDAIPQIGQDDPDRCLLFNYNLVHPNSAVLFLPGEYSREEDPLLRCDCFMPCQQVDYDIRLSSALYPGDHVVEHLKHMFNLTEHHIR